MFGNSALLAETIERLDSTGIFVNDIEVLQLAAKVDLSNLERVLETSARLQARNLIVIVDDTDESRVADNLARVAKLSAAYGLRTCLECIVYTGVKTLAQGFRIIERTGDDSIGLVIDPLHIDRAGDGVAEAADRGRLGHPDGASGGGLLTGIPPLHLQGRTPGEEFRPSEHPGLTCVNSATGGGFAR